MPINSRTLAIAAFISVAAIAIGSVLGTLSVPKYEIPVRPSKINEVVADGETVVYDSRMRFYASLKASASLAAVSEELRLAREAGVTDFILDIDLPRDETARKALKSTITKLFVPNTSDTFWLSVDCNPDPTWYESHPDDAAQNDGTSLGIPSIASQAWLEETKTLLAEMTALFETKQKNRIFTGVILRGLREGEWTQPATIDTSPANLRNFQLWLQSRYLSVEKLARAWGGSAPESWEAIALPTTDEPIEGVFLDPVTHALQIDYANYVNETTADIINQLGIHIREATVSDFHTYVAAGNLFTDPRANGGRAIHQHLDRDAISGFVTSSPRLSLPGLPSAPAVGPFEFVNLDTYFTSIEFDEDTNAPRVPANYDRSILVQDLFRNAVISGLDDGYWIIPDPLGSGTFSYEPIWRDISKIVPVRKDMARRVTTQLVTPLTLVFDPDSTIYANKSDFLNQIILDAMGAIIQSGLPFEWKTLEEIQEAPDGSQPVYLFLNLYRTTADKFDALYDSLVRQKATAIWFYAPGVVAETIAAENIASMTGIAIEAREPELTTGSKFAFSGAWIEADQVYSDPRPGIPTYRAVDDLADPLARYKDNDDISAAMKFYDSGWTSIALLDPTITPAFLRDLVYVLGTPIDVMPEPTKGNPLLVRMGNHLIAYSEVDAEVRLELTQYYSVINRLDPSEAWYNRGEIILQISAGETKALYFEPPKDTP